MRRTPTLPRQKADRRGKRSNLEGAVWSLAHTLRVPVSTVSVREEIRGHPHFPSLLSARDALESWGIDSVPLRGDADLLRQVPLPVLVHLNSRGGIFVVVHEIDDEIVRYFDPDVGVGQDSLPGFLARWSGVLLAAEKSDAVRGAASHHAAKEEADERLRTARRWLVWGLTLAVLLVVAGSIAVLRPGVPWAIALLSKIAGLALTIPLVLHYFPQRQSSGGDGRGRTLCRMGERVDCNQVLDSPGAKLWGRIPLAEIGFLYFAGGAACLLLAAMGALVDDALVFLGIASLAAVLMVPYAIYYQAKVLRKWCLFCIGVQWLLVWDALFLVGYTANITAIGAAALGLAVVSWAAPALAWITLRPMFHRSSTTESLHYELLRLRRNPRILRVLMESEQAFQYRPLTGDLVLGFPEAPHRITIVTHPQCRHCAKVHRDVDRLIDRFPDQLSVVFRFLCAEPDSPGRQFAAEVLRCHLAGETEVALQRLQHWFHRRGRDDAHDDAKVNSADDARDSGHANSHVNGRDDAKVNYADGVRDNAHDNRHNNGHDSGAVDSRMNAHVDEIFRANVEWAQSMGIQGTPVVFWDDRRLPPGVPVSDLRFLISSARG